MCAPGAHDQGVRREREVNSFMVAAACRARSSLVIVRLNKPRLSTPRQMPLIVARETLNSSARAARCSPATARARMLSRYAGVIFSRLSTP